MAKQGYATLRWKYPSIQNNSIQSVKISNVDSIMFADGNRRNGKLLSAVKKQRKMFFILSQAWDKEKTLSPHEESNLRPSDSVLQHSTTEPQRLHSERDLF